MRKLIGLAATVLVVTALSGCDDEPANRRITIIVPVDQEELDFMADDSNAELEGLNYDVLVYAEGLSEGEVVTLTAGDTTADEEYTGDVVRFRDFNLGTEEGEVTLVASSGDTRSEEVTVRLVGQIPPCPEVLITQPGDEVTLRTEEDRDPDAPGLQYTIIASTSADPGETALLYVDDSPTGERVTVSATGLAVFEDVTFSEDTHVYQVRIEGAHETCTWPQVSVTVDTDAPACDIIDPGAGVEVLNVDEDSDPGRAGLQRNISVATDGGVEITVALYVDGARTEEDSVAGGEATFEDVTLAEGERRLVASCTDSAGNESRSAPREFFVDSLPPNLRIVSPDDGASINDDSDVVEELAGIQFQVQLASDADDVEGQPVETFIAGSSPLDEPWGRGTISGGTATLYAGASDGTLELVAQVWDAAGNVGTDSITIEVDTEDPQVQIIDPRPDEVLNIASDQRPDRPGMQYTVVACADEDGAASLLSDGSRLGAEGTVESEDCTLPSGETLPYTITFAEASLEEGRRRLSVEFTDRADNVVVSLGVEVTVDTVPPDCSVFAPDCGSTVSSLEMPIRVQLNASHHSTLHVSHTDLGEYLTLEADPGPGGFITFRDVTLETGTNQFSCEAVDEHGNALRTDPAACVVEVRPDYLIDITEPMPGVVLGAADDRDPGPGFAVRVCVRSVTVPDGTTVFVEVDDVEAATATFTGPSTCVDVPIGDGDHTIRVWTDVAGALAEDAVAVSVDLTPPPAVEELSAEVLDRREASIRLHWTAPDEEIETYLIRWSYDPIDTPELFDRAHEVTWESGPSGPGALVAFDINDLTIERDYYVAVRPEDAAGNAGEMTSTSEPVHPGFLAQLTNIGAAGTTLGASLSVAGDLNGDGVDDLVVGAARIGYIYFGPVPETPTWEPDVTITVPNGWASATGVGDVNGDGFPDLAVGAAFAADQAGALYIYFGGPDRVWGDTLDAGDADVVVTGTAARGRMGWTVAGAGDFCGDEDGGDGFMDVLVSAPFAQSNQGHLYVICGGALVPGTVTTVDEAELTILRIVGADVGVLAPSLGIGIAGLGDVNGDRFDDLAVGHFRNGDGEVYVVRGMSAEAIMAESPILTSNARRVQTLVGEGPGQNYGYRVAGMGDLDRDGFADLAVGAPLNADMGEDAGKVYIYLSDGSWPDPTPITLHAEWVARANDELGYCVGMNGAGLGGAPDRSIAHRNRPGDVADLLAITRTGGPTGVGGRIVAVLGGADVVEAGGEITSDRVIDDPTTPEGHDGLGFAFSGLEVTGFERQHIISYVGDIDGDGYEDFAVANLEINAYGGQVAVYY